MKDELLDLVNNQDEVIGTIWRSQYAQLTEKKLGNIRAVAMLIKNKDRKLWIPKRTADKEIAPDALDFSMAGHVSSGESYIQSALREIREELNLDLNEADLQLVKKFAPMELPYFRELYTCDSDEAPDFNKQDYVSAEWLTPRELLDKIDAGVPAQLIMRVAISAVAETL